jgi:predicted transcriptional regulator
MTTLTVDLSDDLEAELRAAAEAAGVTEAEFAATAVAAALDERRHAEVMVIATRVLATDAVIVHRLGTA